MIEIRSYQYTKNGRTFHAQCYPYVHGKPLPSIAHCRYCRLYDPREEEICLGWKDDPDSAPLFCGPVCSKFDLVDGKRRQLECSRNDGTRYRRTAEHPETGVYLLMPGCTRTGAPNQESVKFTSSTDHLLPGNFPLL